MNLKLQRIIQKLEKKFPRKIDLTLDRQFKILNKLGNPQDKLERVIAVVGTNSKYTLAKVTSSILNEAGHKCNLFLSPHLQSYTERFIYNNNEISEENLIELLVDIEKIIGDNPCTLFEALTCAHLKYDEIGDELCWPGKTKTIQKISPKTMDKLGLKRVDIPSKAGYAIIWNCGVPHGNTACKDVPRLTLYINYQPDTTDTTADKIIGLGNQPKNG